MDYEAKKYFISEKALVDDEIDSVFVQMEIEREWVEKDLAEEYLKNQAKLEFEMVEREEVLEQIEKEIELELKEKEELELEIDEIEKQVFLESLWEKNGVRNENLWFANFLFFQEVKETVEPDTVFMSEDGVRKPFKSFAVGEFLHHDFTFCADGIIPHARVFPGGFHCFVCRITAVLPARNGNVNECMSVNK